MKKILCVVGTRPEAIKMAPIINELKRNKWAETIVLATAQHRQLLDQVNNFFGIIPDIDLDIMLPNQTLGDLTSRLLEKVQIVLLKEKPDVVLIQGDTTTVMAVALASFYLKIPVGHIEAGLRTWDLNNPFPEEANRVITSKLSKWHFAPTEKSKENLIRDGISESMIFVCGNTVIDALLQTASKDIKIGINLDPTKRLILVTAHRRENFGDSFKEICQALLWLAQHNEDVQILYPVHPNPNIHEIANNLLSKQKNIMLCSPLEYAPFVAAMKSSYLIISDSGGVQEEAPALGKPVLVLRDESERPEAIEMGVVKIVGPHFESIIKEAQLLIDDINIYNTMAKGVSPYGDGQSAKRIAEILRNQLDLN